MSLAQPPNRAELVNFEGGEAKEEGDALNDSHGDVVLRVAAGNESLQKIVNVTTQADDVTREVLEKRRSLEMDEAKGNGNDSDEMEEIKDEELRAQIKAQLVSATPIFDSKGLTALHRVAESGLGGGGGAVVARLLGACPALIDSVSQCGGEEKSDPSNPATVYAGCTALHIAARNGHAAIVGQLLAVKPTSIEARTEKGSTVLHCAARGGLGATVLHRAAWAVQSGNEALIAQLLAAKPALIEARLNDGQTALHLAAHCGHAERVAQLLAAKASIEARANDGRTVLHCAVIGKSPEIVSQLLAAKPASIEARLDDGKTVLHCAVGHEEITAQLLAAHPALLDAITNDTDNWSALLNLIQMGHEEAMSRLLAMHPELINRTSPDCGWTVFHFAACYGCDKIMSRLLASVVSQPDLDKLEQLLLRRSTVCRDFASQGSTALHVAARPSRTRHTEEASRTSIITQLLAACPALIDVVDDGNQTCLHCAARWSPESIVELLLSFKPALAHAVDAEGNTILHLMLSTRLQRVGREVLQRVWMMNPAALHVSCGGFTPFDLAVYAGNDVAVELLQWGLTFDELMNGKCKREDYVARFKSLMELQCGELSAVLLPDVVGMVFEYVGATAAKPRIERGTSG